MSADPFAGKSDAQIAAEGRMLMELYANEHPDPQQREFCENMLDQLLAMPDAMVAQLARFYAKTP